MKIIIDLIVLTTFLFLFLQHELFIKIYFDIFGFQ